jgi:hypothetical protein
LSCGSTGGITVFAAIFGGVGPGGNRRAGLAPMIFAVAFVLAELTIGHS